LDPVSTPLDRKSTTLAAKATGASRSYVADAKALKAAAPEDFDAVKRGEMTLPQAKRKRDERDERIRTLHEQGYATGEIRKLLGCSAATVQDAKRRLNPAKRDTNPLRGITNYAIEFCDTWDAVLTAGKAHLASATPEQIEELAEQLEELRRKTSELIECARALSVGGAA
jgi:hypothetical protein